MTAKQIILRVDATHALRVLVGDRIHQGERLSESSNENGRLAAPVSGIVKRIEFDPNRHEFVIAIEPKG